MQNNLINGNKYRSDIDGLRAIAVIAVVGFHFFPNWIFGGYIGVDIFFVISGYLITSIIYNQLLEKKFSIINFYVKRIKRIFPALITVLIATIIFGYFTLTDKEYELLGRHVKASATFLSNFYYWREAGYFDNRAESKPLLHLWSLAIEEQFYIIWPFILLVIYRFKNKILYLTIFLFLLSLIFNIVNIYFDKIETFYSPFTRFWELLAGSFLSYNQVKENNFLKNIKLRYINIFSILGLSLIIYALFVFNKNTNFPGIKALIPVFGACLIIFSNNNSFINKKILSSKILVYIGLISYPIYLWHWPLLFFYNLGLKFNEPENSHLIEKFILILLTIFLSFLTYKLIEIPIRFKMKSNKTPIILILLMLVIGLIGVDLYKNNSKSIFIIYRNQNYSPLMKKIIEASEFRSYPEPPRQYSITQDDIEYKALGKSNKNNILFLGDSHTSQYWNGIYEIIKDLSDNSYRILLKDTFDISSIELKDKIIHNHSIKTVVISHYWSLVYGSPKVNQEIRCCGDGKGGIVGSVISSIKNSQQQDELDKIIKNFVEKLRKNHKEVYIILDNPFGEELDAHSSIDRGLFSIKYKEPKILKTSEALQRTQPIRDRIIKIANETNSKIIDPFPYLCDKNICKLIDENGEILYKDYDHLSLYASTHHTKYLKVIFNKINMDK